jgi:PAS domain S-box-containing protein
VSTRTKPVSNVMVPLQSLFEAMSDGVLITDENGFRTYSNPALDALVGGDAREPASSASPPEWVPVQLRSRYVEYVRQATRGGMSGPAVALEWGVTDASGSHIPVVVKLLPMVGAAGGASALLWLIQSSPAASGNGSGVRQRVLEESLRRIGAEISRLGFAAEAPTPAEAREFPGRERLSPRELEVVGLLLEGHRVVSIADELGVSEHTVRNHLKSIFRKLDVHSQADLVRHVREGHPD